MRNFRQFDKSGTGASGTRLRRVGTRRLRIEPLEDRRLLAVLTVNTIDDLDDGVADASHTSLREAINAANATPVSDTIEFNIPGDGPHTIQPTSELPTITDPVIIDGYSQPGSSPNTNAPDLGTNADIRVELSGLSVTDLPVRGLSITSDGSTVRGLAM